MFTRTCHLSYLSAISVPLIVDARDGMPAAGKRDESRGGIAT